MPAAVITAALAVFVIFSASIMSEKVNGIRAVGEFTAMQNVISAKAETQNIQYWANWMPAFASMTKKTPNSNK
jgi:hypothetical protein